MNAILEKNMFLHGYRESISISVCKLKKGFAMVDFSPIKITKENESDIRAQLLAANIPEKKINSIMKDGKISQKEFRKYFSQGQLEKTANEGKVIEKTTTETVNLADLCKQFNITDINELKNKLQKAGIDCTNDNVLIDEKSKAVLSDLLKEYQPAKAKFTEETPPALIKYFVEQGIIKQEDDGSYTVLNDEKLQEYMKKKVNKKLPQVFN